MASSPVSPTVAGTPSSPSAVAPPRSSSPGAPGFAPPGTSAMANWPLLNLRECLPDPPLHRKAIEDAEAGLAQFEGLMKSLIKSVRSSLDAARTMNEKQQSMVSELARVTRAVSDGDAQFDPFIDRLETELSMLNERHASMVNLTQQIFLEEIEHFLANDVSSLKDVRKKFNNASDALDSALDKYLSKKAHDASIPESARDVADARKAFHEASLAYCTRLNAVRATRKTDLMRRVIDMVLLTNAYHNQAYDLLKGFMQRVHTFGEAARPLEDEARTQNAAMDRLRTRLLESQANTYNPMNKGIFDSFKSTGQPAPPTPASQPDPDDAGNHDWAFVDQEPTLKAGYLLKKNQAQRMRVTWSRRYFAIRGELLVYSQRDKDIEPVVAVNLRLSTVKPCDERRYTFQIISSQKTYTLQAENDEDMNSWIEALQKGIGNALHSAGPPSPHGTSRTSGGKKEVLGKQQLQAEEVSPQILEANRAMEEQKQVVARIRAVDGNNACCDCGAEDPEWAAINLGVVVCIECSGIHRSLGVHISKVRSLILDKWEPDNVEVMLRMGNAKVNAVFLRLAKTSGAEYAALAPTADRPTRVKHISSKYVAKEWIARDSVLAQLEGASSAVTPGSPPSLHEAFWDAVRHGDLARALALLAVGASVDWQHPAHQYRSPLHQALREGDNVAAEFLLQWQCNVNLQDKDGWTALHYAADAKNNQMAHRLVRRCGAAWDVKDAMKRTPLDIATAKEDPLITTMLRLIALEPSHGSSKFGINEALSDTNAKGAGGAAPLSGAGSTTSSSIARKPVPSAATAPAFAAPAQEEAFATAWNDNAFAAPTGPVGSGASANMAGSMSASSSYFATSASMEPSGFETSVPSAASPSPSAFARPAAGASPVPKTTAAAAVLEENPWG
ncbi:hypothetical protein H9P43_001051 [Blastocladiella emersonii ATCC 22665]|nr:hypothetical protein H9P43_001051 [Blastocladiella emersonii ATCC 22665]